MLIRRLRLEYFRNIRELDLELAPGRTVLHGDNGQGKTNILEALFMLAAAKSVRARHEREIVSLKSDADIPYARVEAEVQKSGGGEPRLTIDIVLQRTPGGPGGEGAHLQKRVRVNGVNRSAAGLVGEVQAVLFEPQDVELVFGPPLTRRRYLDLTLSQIDSRLFRSLQEYNRVLAQRNSLLKAIRERRAGVDELPYWDEGLVTAGAVVVGARRTALERLGALASETHGELTDGAERLDLTYVPSLAGALEAGEDEIGALFNEALAEGREREVAQGTTLVGPHRDDFTFTVGGANLATFGSRGQQRLATLALKLAEARFMEERTGEPPVLLLDDVLSELDPARRRYLTERVERHAQAIITTADLAAFEADFLEGSRVLRVAGGAVDAC